MSVQIVVDDSSPQAQLAKMFAFMSDTGLRAFMETVASPILQERASARFAGGGDDAVGPWRPLKSSTRSIKRSMGMDNGINIRTGGLLRWLTRDPDPMVVGAGGETWMMWPGVPGSTSLEDKLETAQVGSSGVLKDTNSRSAQVRSGTHFFTVPRPVVGISQIDEKAITAGLKVWIEG